jgi:bifunctional non-homologous end joining protein LigD
VALDRHGRPDFRELAAGGSAIAYAVFDILWLDGEDLRPLPLAERKRRLDLAVPANTACLMKVLSIGNDGNALFRAAQRLDLAGIVAKRTADPYAAGTVWFQVPNAGYRRREGGA